MGIFSWFVSGGSEDPPRWVRRWVLPGPGRDDAKVDETKRAASADVDAMEEEQRYFRQDGPGHVEDEL